MAGFKDPARGVPKESQRTVEEGFYFQNVTPLGGMPP